MLVHYKLFDETGPVKGKKQIWQFCLRNALLHTTKKFVSVPVDHQKAENPYLSKYGEDKWMDAISKSPTLHLVCPISDLINHMAIQSTNAMKNTKFEGKGLFYHNMLSQLTEKNSGMDEAK